MTDNGSFQVKHREALSAIAPYVPGRNHEAVRRQYGLTEIAKLASNENPFGPSPLVLEALHAAVAAVGRYPDGASADLRDALAQRFDLTPANLVTGNGSDELILLIALAYLEVGAEAVLASPPYGIHRTAVLAAGGKAVTVPLKDHVHDLDGMQKAINARTRLVFLANPHNPTGTHFGRAALAGFLGGLPNSVLVVVDEAYHEFVDDSARHSARGLLEQHPNVVTLRTFSKAYGLAGLRAGYAIAHPEVVRALDRIRPPFGLNTLAQSAALAALDDREHLARVVLETRKGRTRLEAFAHRHDLESIPSQANFVLMRAPVEMPLAEKLTERGVIVRPGENLGMPGWIRVSVGLPEEMESFECHAVEVLAAARGL